MLKKLFSLFRSDPTIRVQLLHPLAQYPVPAHGYEEDAGADLKSVEDVVIQPGATVAVPTGLAFELPPGYEAQVRSRSGLSLKGIVVANSPGTIDPGFRGEVKVILANRGEHPFTIKAGNNIAQVVIARYERAKWVEGNLSLSERGINGFGSTDASGVVAVTLSVAATTINM